MQLINSFSPQEIKEIRKFLESPFFNQRKDLVELFGTLSSGTKPDKAAVKTQLFGKITIDDQELRLRMTYLMRLIERYMAQKEFESDEMRVRVNLVRGLRKRNLPAAFERTKTSMEKTLEKAPRRDAAYYATSFELQWENYQFYYPRDPTDLRHLQAASVSADVAYLSLKLRQICLQIVHRSLYSADYQEIWEKEVVEIAGLHFASSHPAIAIYLHCYRMLKSPGEEVHFQNFKNLLLADSGTFILEEIHGLYLWAINYCIRKINSGDRQYFYEVSALYKSGLEKSYLLENGILSQYTYHNAVASGLQTGDHEWVNHVIHQYKNSLERQFRESAFSFNLARLAFAKKNYGSVIELLQKSNYRDVLINLATKTLLLKTYYELDEFDLLQSHLDAMLNYIRRKRVIGYHRTNYTNIVRFATKLQQLNFAGKKEVAALRAAIENEKVLTEKEWFLSQLN